MKRPLSHVKSTIAILVTMLPVFFSHASVFAYNGAIISTDSDGKEGIIEVLKIAVNIMSALIVVLAIVGIVISGVQYLTAGGNEDQIKKSKRRIFEIVIGMAAYAVLYGFLSWLIPNFPT